MRDIVIIPTYIRAEFLSLCLNNLALTQATDSHKEFWVCEDFRYDDEYRYRMLFEWTKEVIALWPNMDIKYFRSTPHSYYGNSRNVLEAYRRAEQTDARYVYLVEDDVFVMPDFFRWHEAVLEKQPDVFCSVSYRNREHKTQSDPTAYFRTKHDYASIGVCWPRENLAPIQAYACDEYYQNPEAYLKKYFPNHPYQGDFSEQDGLIQRVMGQVDWCTVWSSVPRAYHFGWYGYHRGNGRRPEGFWRQKADEIWSIVQDPERVKKADVDFHDIDPYPLPYDYSWSAESLHEVKK